MGATVEHTAPDLDARRRSVTLNGRTTLLQEKAWQVLDLIIARAPEVVSRDELIDVVWRGNFLTGQKGLNQAIWAIRSALREDPREPVFIRTVPRLGYQWVHRVEPRPQVKGARRFDWSRSMPASITALLLFFVAVAYVTSLWPGSGAHSELQAADLVATSAYLVGHDVHVDLVDGRKRILKNANRREVGRPILSADGTEVAVSLREPDGCRLLMINLTSGAMHEFGHCPT